MQIEVWESSKMNGPVDSHAFDIKTLELDDCKSSILIDAETKHVTSMQDDGDGVIIKLDNKKIKLNYYECVQVLVLLQSNVDQNFEFRQSHLIKSF